MAERFHYHAANVKEMLSSLEGHNDTEPTLGQDALGEIMVRLDLLLATLGSNSTSERSARQVPPSDKPSNPVRQTREPLPDPRMVRDIIRARQMWLRFFGEDLFADPAWDMLLDLTAAKAEHRRVSITSLCIASGVPPTTALRWIGQMVEAGLFERVEDESDRRRAFIQLSDRAADGMARYFAELGRSAAALV